MTGLHRTATRLLWSWAIGRLTRSDAPGTVQTVQGQFSCDRLIDGAKLVQHFGFASRPPADTDLVAICPSGEPTSALVIATNSQAHRPPALEVGDVALHDVRGAYVWLSKDGLHIEAKGLPVRVSGATTVTVVASDKIRLETPLVEVTGDVVDHCETNHVSLKQLRDAYNLHKHLGVQSGPSATLLTDHLAI